MEAKATAEAWFRVERWALILLCAAAVCLLAAMGARRQLTPEAEVEAELRSATTYPVPVGDQLEGAAGG